MSLLLEREMLHLANQPGLPESDQLSQYDALVVLGHGNRPDGDLATEGPSLGTIENAYAAAEYIRSGSLCEDGIVIASGAKPEGCTGQFSTTEAEGLAEVISTLTGVKVDREDGSETTFANIRNIRDRLLQELGQKRDTSIEPLRVAVVSSPGHAKRGALLVKKCMGNNAVVEVLPTNASGLTGKSAHESLVTKTKEGVLSVLTRASFIGLDGTSPEGYGEAERRYALALCGSKRIVGKLLDKFTGSNYGS